MASSDLIQRLHRLFSDQKSSYNIMTLAAETGVGPAEIQGALQTLKSEYSAPLEYDAESRSYRYGLTTETSFELPGLQLTATELRGLAIVLNILNDLNPGQGSGELNRIHEQVSRLTEERGVDLSELTQRIRILSATRRPVNQNIYRQVSDALFARKQLHIHYAASDQSLSERNVSPQTLVYYRDHWYLDAWCHKRQQLRTFMLSRINSAYQTNEGAKEFEQQTLNDHFHNSYGIFSGGQQHIAELIFLPGAAHLVAQQQWHPEAQGQWKGDEYHLSLPYNDERELLRDMLSYAPNVIINEPESMKAAYRARLQEALNRNL
jgi:predicted DNA-binding transcriptional regulator YafY